MGAFLVRLLDHDSGAELGRFVVPNILAYEGIQYVLRQIFPPYQAAMSFQVGVCGATVGYPNSSPNPAGGASFGPDLTFDQCTGPAANEGGCYTDEMRTSFGYARQAVSFIASLEADGGALVSLEVVFPNNHSWNPQAGSDWDLPRTPEEIEQPPPEWTPKESWEPVLGYPWQRPRKRCGTDCDPYNPNVCIYPYMHQWDVSGELDWLCDFRKIGGFPITLAFLADSSRSKLIAAAAFRAPVLLRPGMSLHVRYQARIFGTRVSRDFALRFARYAFQKTGGRYDAIYCRPVLNSAPKISRRTTYAELEQHVGADKAIKSMEEFEVLRHVKAKNLTPEQVQAFNTIRAAVGMPQAGQRVAKVVHVDGVHGAEHLIQTGNPNLAGSFAKQEDVAGLSGIGSVSDRLRLDGSNPPFTGESPYAIIETRVNSAIESSARVPKQGDFMTGNPPDEVLNSWQYPFTGNGFTASRDGYLTPEWRTSGGSSVVMDAGLDQGEANTVMRVRNPDGSPKVISVNGQSASDWKLVPDQGSQTGYRWEPLQ